jgi:hypothetical protein
LNSETFDLITVTPYLKKKYLVGFEFGIAEGFEFNFLDHYELQLCLHSVEEYELEILDFFFVIRYHYTKDNSKQVPLWFDYLVLRFLFQKGKLELRIRHEKGAQRILLDDLTNFLVEQINIELSKKKLTPLFMEFGKISEK